MINFHGNRKSIAFVGNVQAYGVMYVQAYGVMCKLRHFADKKILRFNLF